VPATRAITIRDLLTHTSGYSYGSDSIVAPLYAARELGPVAGYGGWYTADKTEPICTSMETVGTLPAVAQPGQQWVYGYNTDILGCVVERASGMSLDKFFAERITGPLKLTDTRFYVDSSQRARLTAVYMSDTANHASRAPDGSRGQGHYVDGPRVSFAGGAGLTSTARDYARFLEMIRRNGTLDGVRALSPRSVALMRTNLVGQRYRGDGSGGFGAGFETVERLDGYRSVGSYGWGGAYGSNYWVDPTNGLVVCWMMQLIPSRSDIVQRIQAGVAQAFVDR
jgi:CubicO group peptidase (beta-lactamase class C family)